MLNGTRFVVNQDPLRGVERAEPTLRREDSFMPSRALAGIDAIHDTTGTDIEADGPIPGPHSMLSFGSAAQDPTKKVVGIFCRNLETLSGAAPDPKTVRRRKLLRFSSIPMRRPRRFDRYLLLQGSSIRELAGKSVGT
jgi:hypothetical protein